MTPSVSAPAAHPAPVEARKPWARPLAVLAGMLVGGLLVLLALLWPPPALGADPDSQGAQLFENHCAGCHIHGGNIIRRGRTLRLDALRRNGLDNPEAIAAVAAGGLGQMSGYGEVLGADGAAVVGSWVWDQAQKGWPRS